MLNMDLLCELRRVCPDFSLSLDFYEGNDLAKLSTLDGDQSIFISQSQTLERLRNCHDSGFEALRSCLVRVA